MLNDIEAMQILVDQLWLVVTQGQVLFVLKLMSVLVAELNRRNQKDLAISLLNVLNQQAFPAGHEILLGQVDPTSGVGAILTDLKYQSSCQPQCQPAVTSPSGANNNATLTSMDKALRGATGTIPKTTDYSLISVYEGYMNLSQWNMGLVYAINTSVLRNDTLLQTVQAIDLTNYIFQGTTEIIIQSLNNLGYQLTQKKLGNACKGGNCGKDLAGAAAVIGAYTGNN